MVYPAQLILLPEGRIRTGDLVTHSSGKWPDPAQSLIFIFSFDFNFSCKPNYLKGVMAICLEGGSDPLRAWSLFIHSYICVARIRTEFGLLFVQLFVGVGRINWGTVRIRFQRKANV